jgi:glycosyltransferase involved in cell wall biosynthesis
VFVRREVEALSSAHEVTVLHLDWQQGMARSNELAGGYAYRHEALSRVDPRAYARSRRIVAELARTHDIVHTHSLTGLIPWVVGRPAKGIPWVHSEHWSAIAAPETAGLAGRCALALLGHRLRRPDAVIAESSRLAAGIRRFRAASTEIVPCVVDPVDVVRAPEPFPLRLVSVGGLIPRKGPLIAIEALELLTQRGVDAALTWVGDGPLHDDVLAEAAHRGISDRVRLTGGLDDEGVSHALGAAALFLLPTQGDNFCVVAAEALTHGRPIVSGAATGAVDYAAPEVSRFVAEQTGSAYADAIVDLASATADMQAVDIAETVKGRFTRATVCAQLSDIYQRADAQFSSTNMGRR